MRRSSYSSDPSRRRAGSRSSAASPAEGSNDPAPEAPDDDETTGTDWTTPTSIPTDSGTRVRPARSPAGVSTASPRGPPRAAVKAGDRWSSSLTSWFDAGARGVELRVVEEPVVLSHHPVAIAVGDAHANVPLTIVGVNLPGGGSGSGAGGGYRRARVRRLRTLTRGAWVTSSDAANVQRVARPSPPSPSRSPPR